MRRAKTAPKHLKHLLAVFLVLVMVAGVLPFAPVGAGQAEAAAETGQVVINEFGQGTSGNSFEWVELVVVGTGPGSTVDMRGWDLGDTTPGDLRFTDDDRWSAVPAGTIIVIYNNVTGKTSNFPADDLDFGNGDFNAVIPHNNSTLFSGSWGSLNNSGGDAVVLRDASDQVVDGISYGTDTTQTPQLSLVGSAKAACYTGGDAAGVNTAANWSIINDGATPETTPGAGNNPANTSWINSLRSGGGGGDTTPPVLVSATVNGNQLVLTYNETLDSASVPSAVYFTVKVNGQAQASPTSVSISGSQVTLTLAAAVNAGDTVTVSYTRGDNPIQDTSGNDADEFTDQVVTNNTPAAALTVSAARVAANGTTVTTRGEVTAVLGTSAWIQDSTAGIRLYGGNITSVQVGQEVEVTGTVKDYYGDREIEVSSYTVLSGDNFPTPTPIAVTIDQVGEANEGQLIRIENAWIVSDYTSGSGGVYITTDGTNKLLVYAQAGAEMKTYLQGLPKGENNKFNFTGISSCYNTTRELFPRTTADIQAVGGGPDTTPPAVSGKNPAENATGVALDAEVSVTFDESIFAGNNAGSITIKDGSNQSVSGVTYAFSGAKLTINHPDFAPNTTYTVAVPAGAVKDAAGNATTRDITWSFTTGSGGSAPGVTPISQVDAVDANGQPTRLNEDNITIEGIALVGKGVLDAGRTIYVQDETGGIALYASSLPDVAQGDRVRVTGKVAFYRGLTELSPGSNPNFLTVLSSGNPLPTPRDTALAELTAFNTAEPLEGTLVRVEARVSSIPSSPDSGGGYNVKITDANGGNEIILRVMTTTGIDPAGALQVGKTYIITGIVGQYDSSSPYTSGYQIFPRAAADIVEKQVVAADKPLIYNVHPANMAFTYNRQPVISASFEKGGADINPLSVKIYLDSQDVTVNAAVYFDAGTQKGTVTYTPAQELAFGEHEVKVSVSDAAYNTREYAWYFVVDDGLATPHFYFGVPHSHTSFSDGQGTPADAYQHAFEKGLDFLVVTDHSNWLEGDQYQESTKEFLPQPGSEWTRTREMAEAFNGQHAGEFLALRGFEMTSSDWGHSNVYNTDKYVEAKNTMTSLSEFYKWLEKQPGAVACFNHPNWPSDSFNNLAYVPEVDRIVNLIEVGNGSPPYSYTRAEEWYYRALDNGWHVGAVNAQDNHAWNWGDQDNLTVVVADQLTKDEFIEALRERKVYATESRTLELTVKANGYWMGSVLDPQDLNGGRLNFEITARDSEQPIDKLELVTNGGKVIASLPGNGQASVTWNPSVEVGTGSHWYVVKVYHKTGKLGFSSPIFVAGGENDVKLVELKINPEPTLPGYDTKLTATVSNMGVRPVDNLEVKFYHDRVSDGNLIGSGSIAHLAAGDKQEVAVTWRPAAAGQNRIYAVLTPIPGVTTVTELSKTVKVVAASGKKILIDQAHSNAEVPGTHNDLMELLRRYGYEASFNTQPITADLLNGVDVLILNTPTDYSKNLTAAEMDAVATWVKNGGSLLVASKSNYQFEGTKQNNYHDGCTMLNPLLTKLGSGIRFNNDNVYEPNSSKNYSGGMKWSVYARTIPPAPSGLNANVEAIRYFSGCSLVDENLQALTNDPASGLEILVAGNKTSYNYNVKPGYYTYNSAIGGENDPNQTAGPNGDQIPLIAKENIGSGRLVVAGRYFYSDYEIVNDVSNTAFTLRLIDWLAHNDRLRTIADVRQNARPGEIVTVQGVVTAPTDNFFDALYIQDETGGICLYGTQGRDLSVGTVVIATGGVQYFEGELELAYENADMEVLYVGPGTPVQPRRLSTREVMLPQYTGMLVQTGGTITEVNEPAQYFKIDDGSGAAYIHVDGYLGVDMSRLKVGDKCTVTGIASIGAAGPRVRVRFPSDVVEGYTPPGQWQLTIMHTNDTHAHLDDDKALVARRATAIKQIRNEAPNNLLLDAGDVFSGTLYFTRYQGQADLECMNMLGYDAMGIGNHEFDKGPQGLATFITGNYATGYKEAPHFPLLNANFDFSAEPALKDLARATVGEEVYGTLGGSIYPAVILDVNGEKVGLFGLTTEDTAEISSPGPNIKINNAFDSAARAVDMLEAKGVNKIIALSHLGWDKDLQLAQQVEGIDVVVGGHSHTVPDQYPTVVTDSQYHTPTLVVQAGEYGRYLGRLDVSFDNTGLVINYGGGLLDLTAKDAQGNYSYAVDQAVYDRLMAYKAPLEDLKNTVVGRTLVALDGDRNNVRTRETNLGNLIADAMLEKGAQAGAVMAITNGGGIRASIDRGDITLGEVLTVMPFGNTLVVLELTGKQIIDALENGVSQVEQKAGRFPQVAGMKFTWDPQKPAGQRIVSVEVKTANGFRPIDRNARYLVATNNFMAGGGDGYTVFKAASRVYDMGFVDYEVFREYLQKHSPVNPQVEGRITERKPAPPGDDSGGGGGGSSSTGTPPGATTPVSDSVIDSALKQAAESGKVTLEANRDKGALALKTEQVNRLVQEAKPVEVNFDNVLLVVPAEVLKAAATLAANVVQVEAQAKPVAKDTAASIAREARNAGQFKLASDVMELELAAYTKDGKKQTLTNFSVSVKIVLSVPAGKRPQAASLVIGRYNETEKAWETLPTTYDEKSGTAIAETSHFSKYALLEKVAQPAVKAFADIQGHWAQKDIELMAAKGVVRGVAPDRFAPDARVTRAEFAALLVNALGLIEAGTIPFRDVPADAWYRQSVARAYAAGLVKGISSTAFAPQAQITRQEMAAMMVRALGRLGRPVEVGADEGTQILSRFTDRREIAPWAANVLAAAVKAGVVLGRGDNLVAPTAGATRAEAVVMLKRVLAAAGRI